MEEPIPPLERTVGQLLVLRGFVPAASLPELWARARARDARHLGSLLVGAALAEGLVSRVAADALLRGQASPESRPSASGLDATFAAGPLPAGATLWEDGPAQSPSPPRAPATERGSPASPTHWDGPLGVPAEVVPEDPGSTRWEEPAAGRPPPAGETLGGPGGTVRGGDTVRRGDTRVQGGDTIRAEVPRAVRKGRVAAAAPLPATPAALLAQLLEGERYQLLPGGHAPGHLGALDRRLRREVVVRVPPAPIAGPADAERFLREARLQAQLDHPAIPRVHDLGQQPDGQPFFTTDPLPGQRLAEHAGAANARRRPALLRAWLRVAAALEHAHAVGLVHGELGPEHVVLGSLGEVWVDGWGRASALPAAAPMLQAVARAPLPPALGGLAARHLAPEVQAGSIDERTDVWGLGVVLLWILVRRLPGQGGRAPDHLRAARRAGVPRELVAIASRALSADPASRYPDARALIQDARAFLDGKPVLAAPESLLLTLRRQARRNPVPAAIAAGGALGLALLVSITLSLVHGSLRRARVSADQAQAASARAERLSRLAELRLEAARQRSAGEEELARARAEQGGDEAVLARFAAAEAAAGRAASKAEEAAALARELGQPALEAASDLEARARRLRGEWVLRAAADPPPLLAGALADWKGLVARDGADAAAQLGRFEAARRVPGEAAEHEAEDAMATLRELEGPLADLARAHELVHEAEELAARGEPASGPADRASALIQAAIASRPDLALGYELRGRAALARVGRGHQSQKSGSVEGPLVDLIHAVRVDPRDPFARLAVLEHWNESYGWHQPWRYEAHLFGAELREAARVTWRLEPGVEQAAYLQLTDLAEASLEGIERRLARLPDPPSEAERRQLVRLRVLHARALLAAGRDAGAAVAALSPPEELPPTLAAEVLVLRAHHLVVTGGGDAAAEALALASRTSGRSRLAHLDLLRAITDPRGDPRAVFSVVSRLDLPRPDPRSGQAQATLPLAAAWFHAGARVKAPLGALVMVRDWLALMGAFSLGNVDPSVDPARLAFARLLLEHDPRAAETGVMPLLVWASANHVLSGGTRPAVEARELLIERARLLGMEDLRREWESLPEGEQPSLEVWVPRAWERSR